MNKLIRAALRGGMAQIRHVTPVPAEHADGVVSAVYAQVIEDFGTLAPPVVLHSPAPLALAGAWALVRETLLVEGVTGRAPKEAVAVAVSEANACPYCVEVHSAALRGLAPAGPDHWAADWVRYGGAPPGRSLPAPPGAATTAELVGVATTFHYLNRMVNVFLVDSPVPSGTPVAARVGIMRVVARTMLRAGPPGPEPGASLGRLPAATLPQDLVWARPAPVVAAAFARTAAVCEAAARRSVPAPVRDMLRTELAEWDGQAAPPGRAWLDAPVAALPPPARPAGRLALLTARASHGVGRSDIDDFRAGGPGDRPLVELTAWASLAAARRLGALLAARS